MISKLGRCEEATYKKVISEIEYGNPFVEALPSNDDAYATMSSSFRVHMFSDAMKNASDLDKKVQLYETQFFLSPLPAYIKLLEAVLGALRARYAKKNPVDSEIVKELIKKIYNVENADNITEFAGRFSEPTITLLGVPGMGKTTCLNTVLGCLPQLIRHDDYYGTAMNTKAQIVYLKIDAPVDGRCITLCKDIFRAIDDVLSKNNLNAVSYYNKYANTSKTSTEMLHQLNVLVETLGIGLIAIDEIQRIVTLNNEKEELVNFIMNFSNESQLPIILIGTNDAEVLFEDKFFMARRSESCLINMLPFKEKSKEWEHLINSMWEMQLLQNVEPMSTEISSTLYKYSGGITAILLLLFKYSQRNSLAQKKPLNVEMVEKTAETDLKNITRLILDKENLGSKYSDLISSAEKNWETYNAKSKKEQDKEFARLVENSGYGNRVVYAVVKNVLDDKMFDISESKIKKIVLEIYENEPLLNSTSIQKKVYEKLFSMEANNSSEDRELKTTGKKEVQKATKKTGKNITIINAVLLDKAPMNDFE